MQTLYGELNPMACILESVKESIQLDQVSYRFARVSADLASSSSQIAEWGAFGLQQMYVQALLPKYTISRHLKNTHFTGASECGTLVVVV
jgi:hypothetical protein